MPLDRRCASRRTSRELVVAMAESYLRENACQPVPLTELCRMVGLSERGLRNAFHAVRGMSPTRAALQTRLLEVRRALTDPHAGSVTEVAVRFGFSELGRFAASYRRAFGEAPSDTLRASRCPAAPIASVTRLDHPASARRNGHECFDAGRLLPVTRQAAREVASGANQTSGSPAPSSGSG
jgi:AraC-like DNA-binding protein